MDTPVGDHDPLSRLGPSLFLTVLGCSDFPTVLRCEQVSQSWRQVLALHEKSIWRGACHRVGVEKRHMSILEEMERAFEEPVWQDEPGEEEPMPPDDPGGTVHWRGICRDFVELDRNWRFGRCREQWITPLNNVVWRFKIDSEENIAVTTSRTGGLVVEDTSREELGTLFVMTGVRPMAHIEMAKGHVVFDVGEAELGIQVYRTQSAINRSNHPTPAPAQRPPLAETAVGVPGFNGKTWTRTIPRGHLLYYRSIHPPTSCRAFRAQSEGDRAVLATAGSEAVYLWDLDDASSTVTIPLPGNFDIQYVEFDPDYVFICSETQMHVYSRSTRQHVASFPDPHDVYECASSAFALDMLDVTLIPREGGDGGIPMGRADLEGATPEMESWRHVMTRGTEGGMVRSRGTDAVALDFTACHFTSNDLICTAKLGAILIVRNYREAFSKASASDRRRATIDNTVWIGTGTGARLLATDGTHVAAVLASTIVFFDTSSISTSPPTIRIHTPLNLHSQGVGAASCLQMDRTKIYTTYWAAGEEDGGGVQDRATGAQLPLPDETLAGFGLCLRVFDFGK